MDLCTHSIEKNNYLSYAPNVVLTSCYTTCMDLKNCRMQRWFQKDGVSATDPSRCGFEGRGIAGAGTTAPTATILVGSRPIAIDSVPPPGEPPFFFE